MTDPHFYDYTADGTDTSVDLTGLEVAPQGELKIQYAGWDLDTSSAAYEDGYSPLNTGGDFDPTEGRPCTIPGIQVDRWARNIEVCGVAIKPGEDFGFGVYALGQSQIVLDYCTIEDGQMGINAGQTSRVGVKNCVIDSCNYGILATDGSAVTLVGDNYIQDSITAGIYAYYKSAITIRAWDDQPLDRYTTKISTTARRRNYCAVKAECDSVVSVSDPRFLQSYDPMAQLVITSEAEFNAPEYYGVVLESRSMLDGAANVTFKGKDEDGKLLNDGKPTVKAGNRIVSSVNQGAVVTR
jgi:hypothetical protein